MTLLLASVNGAAEAENAVARGVDIVDLRGDATPDSLREVLAAVAGRRAVSAGASDPAQLDALEDTGVDYLKILTRGDAEVIAAAAPLARRTNLLGIMIAEDGIDDTAIAAIAAMASHGFAGVILNTTAGRNLIDALEIPTLRDFTDMVRHHGMIVGLAGALEQPDIPRLLLLEPDILAFRFDGAGIEPIRAQIPVDQRRRPRAGAKVDYRLARPPETEVRRGDKSELDRIFVHDFVLPMRIGTYARERDTEQNVRFCVDVAITRAGSLPRNMPDVLSYDIITDSIRMIAARGHVALVETLAEEVAAAVLRHPRAAKVTVRVEKLETGSGSVGVEITRTPSAEASVHQLFAESDPKASG
ncbi:MAG: dihydroneopterin aldolase [Alphaproteobacteria bacterium]|nr:dihydroneopterin aldolase [Alphaproteobacteria bacterium]